MAYLLDGLTHQLRTAVDHMHDRDGRREGVGLGEVGRHVRSRRGPRSLSLPNEL